MDTAQRVQEALALFRQDRLAEALPLLERLVDEGNTPLVCIFALADAREATGNAEGAARLLENLYHALPHPDHAVALCAVLLRAGAAAALDEWLPRLCTAHPEDRRLAAMQAEHALKRGDWATGFRLAPFRWALSREQSGTAALACAEWDGQPFAGTLLLGTEQGLGEVILWASVFEEIARLGQDTLVSCEARLLPLFRRSFPALRFADRATQPFAPYAGRTDCRRLEMFELGALFRGDAARFPPRAAWLQPDAARRDALRARYRARFPGKRLVGIAWRSHRALRHDSKNIPVEAFAPLLARADTVCVSLQYGDIADDLARLQSLGLPLQVDPEIDTTLDIDGTCALAGALDAVVTSSNTLAHMAGGLGVPTAVLVPGNRYVLWYWGYEGETCPWYPSARIFRGPPRQDWTRLVTAVAGTLPPPGAR